MLRLAKSTNTRSCAAIAAQNTAVPCTRAQEERHEEQAEHHAVEDRGHDVHRLDQVLRQAGEEREARPRPPPTSR